MMTRRDVFEAQQVVYRRWHLLAGHQRAVSQALVFSDRAYMPGYAITPPTLVPAPLPPAYGCCAEHMRWGAISCSCVPCATRTVHRFRAALPPGVELLGG